MLLPYERVSEFFSYLLDHSLNKAILVRAVSKSSKNLRGVEERIRELLAGVKVLNVDTTGMQVIGFWQQLHIASTELLIMCACHRKRCSQTMDAIQILSKFRRTIHLISRSCFTLNSYRIFLIHLEKPYGKVCFWFCSKFLHCIY